MTSSLSSTPLHMTSDIITVTDDYFQNHDSSEWSYASYETFLHDKLPDEPFEFKQTNSRFLTALRKICKLGASNRSATAKSIIDKTQETSARRQRRKQRLQKLMHVNNNHGRITYATNSTIIENLASGTSGTPSPSTSFEEDQTNPDDEAEEQDECVDEYMEGSGRIPCDTHDGWNDTNPNPLTKHRLDTFIDSWPKYDTRTFMCSGRVLEDLIHSGVTADPHNAGDALDWIIDLKAPVVCGWFSKNELSELRSWLPETPPVDASFKYARGRYIGKSTITALRETAGSTPTPPGIHYNRELNFNATYVNTAISSLLSTIEQNATNESIGSPHFHREGWYVSNIWSPLFDHCMGDLNNFTVSRAEIASKVGCPGRRFDAILLAGGVGVDLAEVGAVEMARSGDVLPMRKRQGDEGKLRELMKEMVKTLWETSKCDYKAGSKLQVVGVQQVGFNIRISTMCAVSKGVFVLLPGTWRVVPQTLETFEKVFDVMKAVVVTKAIVSRTLKVLRAAANVKKDEDDFEL